MPPVLIGGQAGMLPEHAAEIAGGLKAAFSADLLYRVRGGGKQLFCPFQTVILQIADWRLVQIRLEAPGSLTFADACRGGDVVQSDGGGIAAADKGEHFLHPNLQDSLLFFRLYGGKLSRMGKQELPDMVQLILYLHFKAGAVLLRVFKGQEWKRAVFRFRTIFLQKRKDVVKVGEKLLLPENSGLQDYAGKLAG